ncbi:MAG: fumarate hydratase [Methanohalobium sp.]|uniref:fumarate hydratase n=1 Tax=Methanohalobium sp. TaxID=2837493 RepID=UPI00397C54A8
MTKITRDSVVDATIHILKQAETTLPDDVVDALKSAGQVESNPLARSQINAVLQNIDIARKHKIPMCQDTGILIFYVKLGRKLALDFDIKDAIEEGVRYATDTIPLRPNAVDPITRKNSGDNTGAGIPDIKYELVNGSKLTITVAPKGAGSENMSALRMFNPTEVDNIKKFAVETVLNAGGKPCPPVILGVGIGGSFDKAPRLAKSALMENVNDMDEFERDILDGINSLGIGPMGIGGDTTALAVRVKKSYCHTASLPVAVNIQCWANRHASITLDGDK